MTLFNKTESVRQFSVLLKWIREKEEWAAVLSKAICVTPQIDNDLVKVSGLQTFKWEEVVATVCFQGGVLSDIYRTHYMLFLSKSKAEPEVYFPIIYI